MANLGPQWPFSLSVEGARCVTRGRRSGKPQPLSAPAISLNGGTGFFLVSTLEDIPYSSVVLCLFVCLRSMALQLLKGVIIRYRFKDMGRPVSPSTVAPHQPLVCSECWVGGNQRSASESTRPPTKTQVVGL